MFSCKKRLFCFDRRAESLILIFSPKNAFYELRRFLAQCGSLELYKTKRKSKVSDLMRKKAKFHQKFKYFGFNCDHKLLKTLSESRVKPSFLDCV